LWTTYLKLFNSGLWADLKAKNYIISKNTQLVIEGFPRSANTFSFLAFDSLIGDNVSGHTHSSAQVLKAISKGLPTVVLIRNPEDAIISYCIYADINIEFSFYKYFRFYNNLLKKMDSFVIAPFEDITDDFGRIILRVNKKFGTSFRTVEHLREFNEKIFSKIDGKNRFKPYTSVEDQNRKIAKPTNYRKVLKEKYKKNFWNPKLAKYRKKAMEIYNLYIEKAGEQDTYLR